MVPIYIDGRVLSNYAIHSRFYAGRTGVKLKREFVRPPNVYTMYIYIYIYTTPLLLILDPEHYMIVLRTRVGLFPANKEQRASQTSLRAISITIIDYIHEFDSVNSQ